MFEFLKSKMFHQFFCLILGVFVVLIFRKTCKGEHCMEHKNPDTNEFISSTYQLGSKCYQFNTTTVDCV